MAISINVLPVHSPQEMQHLTFENLTDVCSYITKVTERFFNVKLNSGKRIISMSKADLLKFLSVCERFQTTSNGGKFQVSIT